MKPARARQDVGAVMGALSRHRFTFQNEAELQAGIERALATDGVTFQREAALNERDRIDFLVLGTLGVEVKIKGGANSVIRQIHRYACSSVEAVLLVTSSLKLAAALPSEMNGKQVYTFCLAEGSL